METEVLYTRKCPKCGDEIKYKYKGGKVRADRNNHTCIKCRIKYSIEKLRKYTKEHQKYKTKEERIKNRKILALKREKERNIRRRSGDIKSAMWYIKERARNRKKEFNLSVEYLKELYNKQNGRCYYTGKKLITNRPNKSGDVGIHTISIDRIDNNRGYIKGNVALCTAWANYAKYRYSEEEFYKECLSMIKHYNYKRKIIKDNKEGNNIRMEQMELF